MFDRQQYEQFLLDTECVGFFDPPITLKSGRPGHWYVNMRNALKNLDTKRQLARHLYDFCMQIGLKPDYFLGVPDGATPLGEELNDLIDYKGPREVPAAILRAGKKSHGDPLNRYSVGPIIPHQHAGLIEDVTTTGGSSMGQILRLQEIPVIIDGLVACVNRFERRDRGRTVQDVLARDYGVKYDALTDARTILPLAAEKLKPSAELLRETESYYERYGIAPIKLL